MDTFPLRTALQNWTERLYFPFVDTKPELLGCIDYRKWLAELSEHLKSTTRYFSHRWFAQTAGIGNPSFFSQVVAGKRNLTPAMVERFSEVFELTDTEALYFRHLVQFEQAKTSLAKQEHYAVLRDLAGSVRTTKLLPQAWDFYRHWWVPALRELVSLRGGCIQASILAGQLRPKISVRQAKQGIDTLIELGLLVQQPDGTWSQANKALCSGDDVRALAIRNHNKQMANLAMEAIERHPPESRHVSGITVGLSKAGYQMLEAEILAFKQRVVRLVDRDSGPGEVFQFNVQLFPLSCQADS